MVIVLYYLLFQQNGVKMTKTELQNSIEFIRLSKAIETTMFSIAYKAFIRSSYDEEYNVEKRCDKICDDVDTSFTAISYCFEDFDCLCDTMCRDFAKSEIMQVIAQCDTLKANDNKFNCYDFILKSITANDVIEDILDMTSED